MSGTTPEPPPVPRRDDAPTEAIRPAGGDASARRARLVIVVSLIVLAVAGLLLAFFVGSRLRSAPPPPAATSAARSASATPTPTPTATPTAVPAGVAAPGVHAWDGLRGGECVDPSASPWERQFTVVDCGGPHPAQLVARGVFPADPAAPYPGEAALTAQLNLLCTSPAVLDLGAAGRYADLQFQAAYPAGEGQWLAGDRGYFCFVFRSSGKALERSLAVGR